MASTGEVWRLGHRQSLDGVRGIAVVLVVLGHSGVPPFANAGAVGVDLFFTLSGFLISSLLLEELLTQGRVTFSEFYRRRALRLLPALVVLVSGVWCIRYVLGFGESWIGLRDTFGALFYYTNFLVLDAPSGALSHTWSLSLEEQFYLTWPFLLVALFRVGRLRAVLMATLGLASVSFGLSIALAGHGPAFRVSFAPDTRSYYLLLGCALAAAMRGAVQLPLPPALAAGVGAALLVATSFCDGGWPSHIAPAVIAVASVKLVWCAAIHDVPALGGRWLLWLGRRSYGIYLWHYPVTVLVGTLTVALAWPARLLIIGGTGVALAALSWRYVEQPFLRMKYPKVDGPLLHDVVAGRARDSDQRGAQDVAAGITRRRSASRLTRM